MQRPNLHDYYLINRGLRQEFGLLALGARVIRNDEHRALLEEQLEIATTLLRLTNSEQDTWVFPTLHERVADAQPGLDSLERDHDDIRPLIETAGNVAESLEARAPALQELHHLLNGHLAREERDAVPLILATMSKSEWEHSQRRIFAGIRREQTPVLYGWLMQATPQEDQLEVLRQLPFTTRLAYRWAWAAMYEKRAQALYG